MEELFKVLKYIGIPGMIGGLVTIIWKVAPLSNLTADIVEVKLFSKEKRLLVKSVKYIFYSLLATAFIFIFVDFIINWLDSVSFTAVNILMFIDLMLFSFLLFLTTFNSGYSETKELIKIFKVKSIVKCVLFIQKQSVIKKLIFFIFYVLLTYISIGLSLSYTIFESGIYLGMREKEEDYLIAIIIFSFLFSLLIPVLFKPGISFINWYKEKQTIYVEDEEDNTKRWYILYPTQKNYVLLGNKKEEFLCTEKKLVHKEDILNKVIYLE
ncbi:hypothetical protein [Ornithinibacillus sp. 179-J 7C1 HS]|uniref:hypothetical protein n=1 Tax=Ornithinibacillus sp. 179-J 7C1 HS TaxID=3142384 RepID=UPI0039A01E04